MSASKAKPVIHVDGWLIWPDGRSRRMTWRERVRWFLTGRLKVRK